MHTRLLLSFSISIIICGTFSYISPVFSAGNSISVPFTSQAPLSDWRQPWQDACEEATIVMIDNYYGDTKPDKYEARDQIRHVLKLKKKTYGYSLDEPAQEIVDIINSFYKWEAYIVDSPTLEQLKGEIDLQRPVLVPTHGKFLYNPHFIGRGPDYHTIVISGYDDETREFITQEPGTRHGLDFRYSYDTILNAMHDYRPGGKTSSGAKVAIFTRHTHTILSGGLDTDHDGLSKEDELEHNTILWLSDSDGDGYSDGEEVSKGYSPTASFYNAKHGDLLISPNSPKVYLIENGKKRHILNEHVFIRYKFNWGDIKKVDQHVLDSLEDAPVLTI